MTVSKKGACSAWGKDKDKFMGPGNRSGLRAHGWHAKVLCCDDTDSVLELVVQTHHPHGVERVN